MTGRRAGPATIRALLLAPLVAGAAGCRSQAVPQTSPPPAFEGSFAVVRDVFSPEAQSRFALGDCNGDGLLDVVRMGRGAGIYVQASDGTFAPADPSAAPALQMPGYDSGTFADLDGDGIPDLVGCASTPAILPGLGGCRFGPPRVLAPDADGQCRQVVVTDVDRDGLPDLSMVRRGSFERPFRLLLARGDGGFEDRTPPPTPRAGHEGSPYLTFGTYFDDVDGDGRPDLFASLDQGRGWFAWGADVDSVTFTRDEVLTEVMGSPDPMGVSPIDFDRDGTIDYFIAGAGGSSRLLHGTGTRTLPDVAPAAGVGGIPPDQLDFGSLSFDADLDGWPDLLVVRETGDRGPSPASLYQNRRNGTFTDTAGGTFDLTAAAEGLVCGDLDGDGLTDCVVGASDGRELILLRNHLVPRGGWVGLELLGTVSSTDASGARVALNGAAPPLGVVVGGQSPTDGEHDRRVVLAIGQATSASVRITWPSGLVQEVSDLPSGRYTRVVEPRTLDVSARVAPADGSTEIIVSVDPAATGAVGVAIERTGAGAWTGPARAEGGRLVRSLRAPTSPGTARVEVALDGHPLRVRPRIRFE